MSSFVAMLFTLRMGLGMAPTHAAMDSLRQQALAVAIQQAAARESAAELAAPVAEIELGWDAPPRRPMTRDEWRRLLERALSNDTIANAAMWIATQPVSVSVSGEKFFVSLRFATP